jgi:hypothetical protein
MLSPACLLPCEQLVLLPRLAMPRCGLADLSTRLGPATRASGVCLDGTLTRWIGEACARRSARSRVGVRVRTLHVARVARVEAPTSRYDLLAMSETDLEQHWERDLARAMREYDRVATPELNPMSAYVRGRWSSTRPTREGVYLVRAPVKGALHSWVAFIDPGPQSTFTAADSIEYFHLEDDVEGAPTRWDDDRVASEARTNGWREQPTHDDGRTRHGR